MPLTFDPPLKDGEALAAELQAPSDNPERVTGYLQADGYGGYDGIAIESNGKLILVACGAHIRRKF